jgi:hypothetical protein
MLSAKGLMIQLKVCYKAPRGDRIEISEWVRTWKEVIMGDVEVKSQHLPTGTEKNHEYMSA